MRELTSLDWNGIAVDRESSLQLRPDLPDKDSAMTMKAIHWKDSQNVLALVLFVLSIAVYCNTYHNRFTYDDVPILQEDNRLRSIGTLPALFTHDYFMVPGHNLYRPLPMLSIAINYLVFGKDPWSYRVINQVLHGLNAVLLFFFLENFFRDRTAFRFLAAAVFAVHPAATETVNLIVYRAELLAFTFSILAFHLYIRRRQNKYDLPLSAVFYFLAMLSKESAMILPLFLLTYHLFFDRVPRKTFFKNMIAFGIAAVVVIGIRYAVLGAFGPQNIQQFFSGIPWTATALTMVKVLAYYWKIVFWPVDLQMNYDFSDFPVASSLFDLRVLFSIAFLTAVLLLAKRLYGKDRSLSFFVIWPFIAFLPVSNVIVPAGVLLAVRLLYFPMAGFSVLLAAILTWLSSQIAVRGLKSRKRAAAVSAIVAAAAIILLSIITLDRNTYFKDTVTLFRRDLELSPRNLLSIKFLAPALPPDEASALLLRAVQIRPADSTVLSMMGEVAEKRGDHAAAELLQRQSLALEPTYRAYKQLGIVLSNTGRLREAEASFGKVIELKPYWSDAYCDLAIVLLKEGRREEALSNIRKALSLNPDSAEAYNLLGSYYKEAGKFTEAAKAFQLSAGLFRNTDEESSGLYEALYNLADAYEKVDAEAALSAWNQYIQAAEHAASEKIWVDRARERVLALSRTSRPQQHRGERVP